MIRVRWKEISFVMRQCAFPNRNVLICIDLQKGCLRDNVFKLHFERVVFCVINSLSFLS